MKLSENSRNVIVVILVVAVLAYFALFYAKQPEPFDRGTKVNPETFLHLLNDAETIYVVMDIRNVSDSATRKNILNCGIDFASSVGLIDRNVKYMALDPEDGCILGDFNHTAIQDIDSCLSLLNSGISLYVTEGNSTEYYTRAAIVGVGADYQPGTCDISYG